MSDDTSTGIDDETRAELDSAGNAHHEPAVGRALSDVGRSHKGRPLDEIESVLRQAVRDATGEQAALSDRSIERVARRIADSAPHA